jgi:hypothetical protein
VINTAAPAPTARINCLDENFMVISLFSLNKKAYLESRTNHKEKAVITRSHAVSDRHMPWTVPFFSDLLISHRNAYAVNPVRLRASPGRSGSGAWLPPG